MTTTNYTTPHGEWLRPCPFCGSTNISEGEVLTRKAYGRLSTQSMCRDCGALGPDAHFREGEIDYGGARASAAWNRRVAASAQPIGEYTANGIMGEREAIPENCDVRKILLRVVPGDGSGHEVYAKDIADVEQLLSEMGERLENFESNRAALTAEKVAAEPVAPVGGREAWEKVLSFSRRIVALLDMTDVIRSTVSGTAYDAAERAVFIRNIATEALAALQPAQPTQAATLSEEQRKAIEQAIAWARRMAPGASRYWILNGLLAAHNGGKHD